MPEFRTPELITPLRATRRLRQLKFLVLSCVFAASSLATVFISAQAEDNQRAVSKAMIEKAIAEYQAGYYDKAALIIQQDLKDHPDEGMSHYYLGLVKKRLGDDSQALNELEWGARLCPPEVIESLAKQVTDYKNDTLPKVPFVVPAKNDWWSVVSTSASELLGGKKPEAKVTDLGAIELPPQDLGGSMDDLYKQGKQWLRSITEKKKAESAAPQAPYHSWAAGIMPMRDMHMIIDKSRHINDATWASHQDGVKKFQQCPEHNASWDHWIARFRRAFQHVLTCYLARDSKGEVTGSAASIFSIDKNGNLRGHIYASTGDGILNDCLLKTIRSLNHSRILEFPYGTKVTGWNFQMSWNFGRILAMIDYAKARRKALMEKQAQEALALTATKAQLQNKVGEQAKPGKPAGKPATKSNTKVASARLIPPPLNVRTKVLGELLPRSAQLQLKAVADSISDKAVTSSKGTKDTDIFSTISDREIMNWPDLSQ